MEFSIGVRDSASPMTMEIVPADFSFTGKFFSAAGGHMKYTEIARPAIPKGNNNTIAQIERPPASDASVPTEASEPMVGVEDGYALGFDVGADVE